MKLPGFDVSRVEFKFSLEPNSGCILEKFIDLSCQDHDLAHPRHKRGNPRISHQSLKPTQAELAEFMGKDVSEYQKERSHAHQMMMVDSEAAEDEMLNVPAQQGLSQRKRSVTRMMMSMR